MPPAAATAPSFGAAYSGLINALYAQRASMQNLHYRVGVLRLVAGQSDARWLDEANDDVMTARTDAVATAATVAEAMRHIASLHHLDVLSEDTLLDVAPAQWREPFTEAFNQLRDLSEEIRHESAVAERLMRAHLRAVQNTIAAHALTTTSYDGNGDTTAASKPGSILVDARA